MAESKLKYIALYELLRKEASIENPLTTSEICLKLSERNISKNARNLPRDIDSLSRLGYSVRKTKIGHENAFYIECDELDEDEVRIIMDSLQAATFITKNKSEGICKKILSVSAQSDSAKAATKSNVIFTTRKATNNDAANNISLLSKAIRLNKKISFKVFDFDENAKHIYHKDGCERTEDPVALVFHKDKYYLLTSNEPGTGKIGDFITYRVDRIDSIKIANDSVSNETIDKRDRVSNFVDNTIEMFGGKSEQVVLKIAKTSLLKYIFEEFGFDSKIIKLSDNEYIASITTDISPTLFGWLFQFGNDVEILRPDYVKEEYLNKAKDIIGGQKND